MIIAKEKSKIQGKIQWNIENTVKKFIVLNWNTWNHITVWSIGYYRQTQKVWLKKKTKKKNDVNGMLFLFELLWNFDSIWHGFHLFKGIFFIKRFFLPWMAGKKKQIRNFFFIVQNFKIHSSYKYHLVNMNKYVSWSRYCW